MFSAAPARGTTRNAYGIVYSENAVPGVVVERQRVCNSMRSRLVRWNAPGHDLDREAATDLDHGPIELEQLFEAFVAVGHLVKISYADNKKKRSIISSAALLSMFAWE